MLGLALVPFAFVAPLPVLFLALFLRDCGRNDLLRAIVVGLSIAVAVHGMRCDQSTDIYRHILLLQSYDVPFTECFDAGHYHSLYVWDVWCWVVEQTHDPYLLQSSSAFVCYTICAFVIFDYCARHNLSNTRAAFSFLFVFCAIPLFPLVTGIRSTAATIVGALAMYLRYEHSVSVWKASAVMLVGVLIHPVSLFLAIIASLSEIALKRPVASSAAMLTLTLFLAELCPVLLSVIPSGNLVGDFFISAIRAFLDYEAGSDWATENVTSLNGVANRLSTIGLCLLLMVPCLAQVLSKNDSDNANLIAMSTLLVIVTSLALYISIPVNAARFLPAAFLLGSLSALWCSSQEEHGFVWKAPMTYVTFFWHFWHCFYICIRCGTD